MTSVADLSAEFNKDHKEQITTLGVLTHSPKRLSTGIFSLDLATGGGIPRGRVSVIYGPESSMKTTVCMKIIAQAQKDLPHLTPVFVDVEGHFDPAWAEQMGVDVDKMIYALPTTAEEMIDLVEALLYADDLSVIVVDSLAALVTGSELDSEAEKAQVGRSGLAINKFYRKTSRALQKAKILGGMPTLVCINQIRYKIGVMYGDPEVMPGGPSFKFASSLTLRLSGKDEFDKKGDDLPTWKKVTVICKKWKVPIVARNSEFVMAIAPVEKYGLDVGGVYDMNTIVSYLKELGHLVKVDGGWGLLNSEDGSLDEFPTQEAMKTQISEDEAFGNRVRSQIIADVLNKGKTIAPA